MVNRQKKGSVGQMDKKDKRKSQRKRQRQERRQQQLNHPSNWFDARSDSSVSEPELVGDWEDALNPSCTGCANDGTPDNPVLWPCNCHQYAFHYNCLVQFITKYAIKDSRCVHCRVTDVGPDGQPIQLRERFQWPGRIQRLLIRPMPFSQWFHLPSTRQRLIALGLGGCLALPAMLGVFNWQIFQELMTDPIAYPELLTLSGGSGLVVTIVGLLRAYGQYIHNYRRDFGDDFHIVRYLPYPDLDSPPLYYNPRDNYLVDPLDPIWEQCQIEEWDGRQP